MDKERRDKLRCDLSSPNCEACDMPGRTEVLALLDMADERDRYRALLEAVKKSRFLSYGWKARIEAELEGNDED